MPGTPRADLHITEHFTSCLGSGTVEVGIESIYHGDLRDGLIPQNRERLLRAAINRLIQPIRHALWLAGVNTEMVLEKYESESFGEDPKKVVRRFDLLEDYFGPDHHGHFEQYERVIEALDRGIGSFEQQQKAAFRQLFNPATWLAWCVRFPITVFERAGLEGEEASSTALKIYGWVIRGLALLVLALLARKLGMTSAWEKLISLIATGK